MLSIIGLAICSPVMLLVAVFVRLKLGAPVIYKQERPGYHERIFSLYKFRTMTNETDGEGNLLPDAKRQTKFGKMLRKTSLDELPELYNILKGDMAFIGPRPLLIKYLPLYNSQQHKRHDVRPGMANLSAIKGRNCLGWIERLELDSWYAENVSFKLDLEIFIKTIFVVAFRKGSPDAVESRRGTLEEAIINSKKEDK